MKTMEAILTRRSIRKYTSSPIPKGVIRELLKAAMSAPSAANKQPWHFVVVDDRTILDRIPEFHPYSNMVVEAPLAIIVCGESDSEGWWVQDCSAAAENLLIAAHAKCLGAVWLGAYPSKPRIDGIRMLLGLPPQIMPLCIIPIGYPAESKDIVNRYDRKKVHRNRW
jgi:nitroreductase